MMSKKIIIIGAGTYGSYLANAFNQKYPGSQIKLIEVGNKLTQAEKEIGFFSKVRGGEYKAASEGRFFGLGGTSAKWGGQLLFFSDKDFSDNTGLREIVGCNIRYRDRVLGRFFDPVPALTESEFGHGLFVKQGVWLKFRQRNMFKHFRLSKQKNIEVLENARVIRINSENKRITSITVQLQDHESPVEFQADLYYLTSGAFESLRLLAASDLLKMDENSHGFSDHVSLRCFEINGGSAKIDSHDFQFSFAGGSMITSRLVGEIDGVSFFIHPIFNEDFKFFQLLKQLMFKGKFSGGQLFSAAKQIFLILPFVYSYFVKKKLYFYGTWFLNIDMELCKSDNSVSLSAEVDRYQQHGIEIRYEVSRDTVNKLLQVKDRAKQILAGANIEFNEVENSQASSIKLEDVYHPFGLFSYTGDQTIFDIYNPLSNLFLFNTGLLRRAGGINPTASIFCLIEHHIDQLVDS